MNVELVEVEPDQEDILWLLTNDARVLTLLALCIVSLIAMLGLCCRRRSLDRRDYSE